MLHTHIYRTGLYARMMRLFDTRVALQTMFDHLHKDTREPLRILDAGCGSGVTGLSLLERFPRGELVATDKEAAPLLSIQASLRGRGIDPSRVTVALADIAAPSRIRLLSGAEITLPPETFDVVCAGAVLGYSPRLDATLRELMGLLKPGGYFVDLEMNERFVGRLISRLYCARVVSGAGLREALAGHCSDFALLDLPAKTFPANLTRVGVVARRRGARPSDDGLEDSASPIRLDELLGEAASISAGPGGGLLPGGAASRQEVGPARVVLEPVNG